LNFSKEIAKISLETGAIKLQPDKPFLWASGYLMPVYNDNRLLLSSAKYRQIINDGFQEIITQKKISVDVVAGTATAGIPAATSLSNALETPLIYVRPSPKIHGMQNKIEGLLYPDQKVVVIEDLISTGGSAIKAVTAIREAGGQVENCLSVFSYGFLKASKQFKNLQCELHHLLNFEELIIISRENNKLSDNQFLMLKSWYDDPFNWGRKNGFTNKTH
jgi:orotate phosphoribosyltransferase